MKKNQKNMSKMPKQIIKNKDNLSEFTYNVDTF